MLAASTLCGPRAHAMATMPGTACAINSSGAEAGCSMQIAAAVRMCCGRQVLLPCSPSRHLSQLPWILSPSAGDVFLDRGNCQMDLYQSLSSAGCASSVLYHAVFRLIHELWSMLRWITTNRDRSCKWSIMGS